MKKSYIILILIILIFTYWGYYVIVDNEIQYNTVIEECLSPNRKYKAVIFERNIDATTSTSYNVSIINADETLNNSKGNVYVSYQLCDVNWIDDNHLQIININEREFFNKKTHIKDIYIYYNK